MEKNPTFKDFLEALDTMKRFVLLLDPLLGASSGFSAPGRPADSDPPAPALSRRPGRKKGQTGGVKWQDAIRNVMQTRAKPMSRAEIIQAIADIQGKATSDIALEVGNRLDDLRPGHR